MENTVSISFNEVELAEAGKLAIELKQYLLENEGIIANLAKEENNTQDLGAILTIVLGSTAVGAFVTALGNWMIKKQSKKISIKKNGDIVGENLSSKDIKNILEHLK